MNSPHFVIATTLLLLRYHLAYPLLSLLAMDSKKVTLKILRFCITPSKLNKRRWAIVPVLDDGNGHEVNGPIRCFGDSKRQAKLLCDQFNHELKRSYAARN